MTSSQLSKSKLNFKIYLDMAIKRVGAGAKIELKAHCHFIKSIPKDRVENSPHVLL